MKGLLTLLLSLFVFISSLHAASGNIENPQVKMIGARSIGVGTTPVFSNELSNAMLNPAAVSDIQKFPVSITTQKLLDNFDYMLLSSGFYRKFKYENGKKVRPFGMALSIGSAALKNIPRVETYNDIPYQTGSFSSGFNVVHLAGGTSFYEKLTFDKVSLGLGVKYIHQYVDSGSGSTFGLDAGFLADYYYSNPYINGVSIGASVHNVISPSLTFSKTGNESLFPISIFLGSRVDMFSDRLSLFASNSPLGVTSGAEFLLQDNLLVRGASNFDSVTMGAGILLDNISTGIPNYNVKLRLDLSYTQELIADGSEEDTFVFSMSSLGKSVPVKPQILYPDNLVTSISDPTISVSGVGPKNATIRIFSNGTFLQTVLTTKKGHWNVDKLRLFEGVNRIHVESFDIKKDAASKSNIVTVVSDTLAPSLDLVVYPEGNALVFNVESSEPLSSISGTIDSKRVRFKRQKRKEDLTKEPVGEFELVPEHFVARIPLPEAFYLDATVPDKMMSIELAATDKSGNKMELPASEFFGSITHPPDKHVHYNDNVLMIGNASNMVKAIYVNDNIVYIDDQQRFSIPVDLKPGKNTVRTKFETLNSKEMHFSSRVLHLVSYDDMTPKVKGRREIEFLSTLGVLYGEDDNNFYPLEFVTREYITKVIVLALDEFVAETVEDDLFLDVPKDHPYAKYIQAGISSGVVFAFPDGSFRPERPMTLSEAVYMLSNAGIIDYEEVEDDDTYVTRAELAEFLAYTAKYERRIEALINWETGYGVDR